MDDLRTGPDVPLAIEKEVWLGVNATVHMNSNTGENIFVAAGRIVSHTMPAKDLEEINAHQPGANQ